MAKAKSAKKKKPASGAAKRPTLAAVRKKIDRLDRQLVELINERADLARTIGEIKSAAGKSIYAPEREAEVLDRVRQLNQGPLGDECVVAVLRELISGSRALEKSLRVAFLGPEHSYSHQAALARFGQSVEFVAVGTIAAVFEEIHGGHAHYGIVPLENSTDGRVVDTLDMFSRLPIRICGEVQLAIHHYLLGRGPRADVRQVYSKPQALSQCRNWLAQHLPKARLTEVASTSAAAQRALEEPSSAAVASRQAGVHYGLDVLAENIEDNSSNLTRFAVIGNDSATRTGHDKTAIMYQVQHEPGALADSMNVFKRNRLNLTWIESLPISEQRGEYLFFVELHGHETDLRVRRAVAALQKKTLRIEVLGSFSQVAPVE